MQLNILAENYDDPHRNVSLVSPKSNESDNRVEVRTASKFLPEDFNRTQTPVESDVGSDAGGRVDKQSIGERLPSQIYCTIQFIFARISNRNWLNHSKVSLIRSVFKGLQGI